MSELTDGGQAVIRMFRRYLAEHPDLAEQVVETDIIGHELRYDFASVRDELFLVVKSNGIIVPVESKGSCMTS